LSDPIALNRLGKLMELTTAPINQTEVSLVVLAAVGQTDHDWCRDFDHETWSGEPYVTVDPHRVAVADLLHRLDPTIWK
jgi:hypothetical protein